MGKYEFPLIDLPIRPNPSSSGKQGIAWDTQKLLLGIKNVIDEEKSSGVAKDIESTETIIVVGEEKIEFGEGELGELLGFGAPVINSAPAIVTLLGIEDIDNLAPTAL